MTKERYLEKYEWLLIMMSLAMFMSGVITLSPI
jgi:hypothetical protein